VKCDISLYFVFLIDFAVKRREKSGVKNSHVINVSSLFQLSGVYIFFHLKLIS